MDPDFNVTPSAKAVIPASMEHIEAKQAAVDAERLAYIATLPTDARERLEIVEQCVALLKGAKIPFSLTVRPEPRHPETVRCSVWQHQFIQYGDPFTNRDDAIECQDTMYQMMCVLAERFAKPMGMMVAICGMDGSIHHIANKPDKLPTPPAE